MIKTGIALNLPDVTNLVRMLRRHPDVDIVWMHNFNRTHSITYDFPQLIGELDLKYTDTPDFKAIDLYVGSPFRNPNDFADNPNLKTIFCAPYMDCAGSVNCPVEIGLPEYNRKALVRGARAAYTPDEITYLGALALMPLTKNLLLGSPVGGSVLLNHSDAHKGDLEGWGKYVGSFLTHELCEKVLLPLQNSFNQPLNLLAFNTAGNVSMGTFVIDTRMNLCDIRQLYHSFYDDHRHVVILPENVPAVAAKMVEGTNKAVIGLNLDAGKLFITVAFDGRMKTGAGNIIHIMNLLFGLDERTGL